MKGHADKPSGTIRQAGAANVRGQMLGHEVTTKAVLPTSAKAVGLEVEALLKPMQDGKRGKQFVAPALLSAWPEIVGERLAGLCMPVHMKPQPKSRSRHKKASDDGAILEVRADPAVQIDLDYGQALLVERINAFFGYHAVARLKVLAKPMSHSSSNPSKQAPAPQAKPTPPTQSAIAEAHEQVSGVADAGLREALEKLGACVLSANKR